MPLTCTVIIEGELDRRFDAAFDALKLSTHAGRSELTGPVADQAALQGLLRQLFDLGLNVTSFTTAPLLDATSAHPAGPARPGE